MSRPLVTVKTLLAQARGGGPIDLAADALITPAAADWLAATRLPVRRVEGPAPGPVGEPGLYLVADGAHPTVRALLPILERRYGSMAFWSCRGHVVGLMEALGQACDALAADPARRCVVVMKDGSTAQLVSNKRPHVRAAIGHRPSQLTGLMRNLGINMLILEHDRVSLRQMQGMIETFSTGATSLDPVVGAALGGSSAAGSAVISTPGPSCGCANANG
jgi:hypothetical protein